MDFNRKLGFITIMKESIKLFGKNGKLMASITTLSMISYSIFFFIFSSSSSFFMIHDLVVKESMAPVLSTVISKFVSDATGIRSNILPHTFLPLYFILTFLSMISTVTVSSYSCNGNYFLSAKELSSSIMKSWSRSLRTGFYTTILVVGYESLVLYIAIPLITSSLVPSSFATRVTAIIYGVAAFVFYIYVSGVWILSLVVSVVDEDGGGIVALGKSAEMIEGQRLDVFLLNAFFYLVHFLVLIGLMGVGGGDNHLKIWELVVVSCYCFLRVFTFVAYTVLYFGGKEGFYGDLKVELQGSDAGV